jgi:hypothetical protein
MFGLNLPPRVMAILANPKDALELMKATMIAVNELIAAVEVIKEEEADALEGNERVPLDLDPLYARNEALKLQVAKIKELLP